MAIADTITSMKTHINDAYSKISDKGGTVPTNKNLANLSSAIDTITTGGGGGSADLDALIDRSITSITNSTVTSIGNYAFSGCTLLTTAEFPNVTSIGSYAFSYCSKLTTAEFPNVTSIGSYAFSNCTLLTTAKFPNATSIDSAFYYCTSLTTAKFPNVTSIGSYAFYKCTSLTTAEFPLVTSIDVYAFYKCTSLTTLDFPNVTSIGYRMMGSTFTNCDNLSTFIIRTTSGVCTLVSGDDFFNTPIENSTTSGYIYVPDDLVDSYKSATNWSIYASKIKGLSEL